jgi:hypothetical protein
MQIQLIDLAAIPITTLFYILILFLRHRYISNATNILEQKTLDIWTEVYPTLSEQIDRLQDIASQTTESFNRFADQTKQKFLNQITKTVIFYSYYSVLGIGFFLSFTASLFFPLDISYRIIWIESSIVVFIILFIFDAITTRLSSEKVETIRRYLCGFGERWKITISVVIMTMLLSILVVVFSSILANQTTNTILQISEILAVISVILSQVLNEIGVNHWKIRNQYLISLKETAKKALECTIGLFLLEQAHNRASERFREFDLEGKIDFDDVFKPTNEIIDNGKVVLSGKSDFRDASIFERKNSQIILYFRKCFSTEISELVLQCFDSYTNQLESTKTGMQFCLSFAFSNKDYLDRVVSEKRGFLSDRQMMISSIMHIVEEHHSNSDRQLEKELLARIGVDEVRAQIKDGEIRMAPVIQKIELHSSHVEKITEFLGFAEELHIQEMGESSFNYPTEFDSLAAILSMKPSGIDDEVLETAYRSAKKTQLDLCIVCASRPDSLQRHAERISWLEKYLAQDILDNSQKQSQLKIPIRLWLEKQEQEEHLENEVADMVSQILVESPHRININRILSVGARVLALIPQLRNQMELRTNPTKERQAILLDEFTSFLSSKDDSLIAIALLAMYGKRHFQASFPMAVGEAIESIRQSLVFSWSEIATDSLYGSFTRENKIELIKVLLHQSIDAFRNKKFGEIQKAYPCLLSAVSYSIANSKGAFSEVFLDMTRRVFSSLEYLTYLSDGSWLDITTNISQKSVDGLEGIIRSEDNSETLALSFAITSLSNNEDTLQNYVEKMVDDKVYSKGKLLAIIKHWKLLGVSKNLFSSTIHRILKKGVPFPDVEYDDTRNQLENLFSQMIQTSIASFHTISRKEISYLESRELVPLYRHMLNQEERKLSRLLVNVVDLSRVILGCSVYPLDFQMLRIEKLDPTEILESISELVRVKSSNTRSKILYNTLKTIFKDTLRGEPTDSYTKFLVAVTVNNEHVKMNESDLDMFCRRELQKDNDGLDYAVLFKFIYQDGQNPLALTFTDLDVEMKGRLLLRKESESSDEDWSLSREELKSQIMEDRFWVDRLRFLDPVRRKIREAHSRIADLMADLQKEGDLARDARALANRLLTLDIADEKVIEYISKRSYNYFLLSWETPSSQTGDKDADTLGKRIDDWLNERERFYGYTIKLTRSTRIGRIPSGMTFEEFKRFMGRDLMNIRKQLKKKPNVFLVCWSPSRYSAHALSGEETLEMNPIESLRRTFRKKPVGKATENIDLFIDRQFLGPRSMEDAAAALVESNARVMSFWEDNPLDFMLKFAILSDEMKNFIKGHRERMSKLYNSMKGTKDLHEFAQIDARREAAVYVDSIFKGFWSNTKDMAVETAVQMLYTLKLVLILDIEPKTIKE